MNMEKKKDVLLNIRHLDVKFKVRSRILTAIRDVTFEIYRGESLAIVGESGSGKSVLTKTFTGMLESNGIISHGKIIYHNKKLERVMVHIDGIDIFYYEHLKKAISEAVKSLSVETVTKTIDANNVKNMKVEETMAVATAVEKLQSTSKVKESDEDEINELKRFSYRETKQAQKKVKEDYRAQFKAIHVRSDAELKEIEKLIKENKEICTPEFINNLCIDLVCSIDRFPPWRKFKAYRAFKKVFIGALNSNVILTPKRVERLTSKVTFVVTPDTKITKLEKGQDIKASCMVDLAKVKLNSDWEKIRGIRIATVFQDPMTSLNPIRTIGSQITEVIIKHQKKSKEEAHNDAVTLMEKVGIYDAEKRFNDYPFQYSGGMRQRIVIAIALACRPEVLICDEPTTALDVTIQAQIINLIKDLQKEYGYTCIYITHDLGVVASVADRVAVLYGGQIVEIGTVDEIYFKSCHPYTWALLSALPQLSEKGSELFSIKGTPPSLYNEIKGDAFAPRNPYALKIDFDEEPPMFQVSPTHFAKTWLLDPRAPKVQPPKIIHNLHQKMQDKANWEEVISDDK
jgi:oligopeptide transport system ATP-binding protein